MFLAPSIVVRSVRRNRAKYLRHLVLGFLVEGLEPSLPNRRYGHRLFRLGATLQPHGTQWGLMLRSRSNAATDHRDQSSCSSAIVVAQSYRYTKTRRYIIRCGMPCACSLAIHPTSTPWSSPVCFLREVGFGIIQITKLRSHLFFYNP
jgi:hypothetical protein